MNKNYFIVSLVALFLFSCAQEQKRNIVTDTSSISLLKPLDKSQTNLDFVNKVVEDLQINTFSFDGLLQGSGVAVLDVDNDGLQDIYFASTQGQDRLYLNKGGLKFEDITKSAGIEQGVYYSTGISIVDLNADGYDDIYVNRFMHNDLQTRRNKLYINQKDGSFKDEAKAYKVDDAGYSISATFFDYDRDNDLDLYVANQPPNDIYNKQSLKGKIDYSYSDRIYRNDGGTFKDMTVPTGMKNYCYSLSANPVDYNNDGWIDIFVAVDYEEPDLLWKNNGDGTFTNVANEALRHISNFSMGTDIADINNDGLLDIFTVDMVAEDNFRQKTNMSGMNPEKFWKLANNGYHYQYMFNAMQLNNGNGNFSEIGQLSGISNSDWSWTPLFVDFDQDGFQDLLVTNGVFKEVRNKDYDIWRKAYFKKAQEEQKRTGSAELKYDPIEISNRAPSIKLSNFIYKNNGDLTFEKMTDAWNFGEPSWSSGAAYSDFDNDGDMDVVINNTNMECFFYQNMANEEALNNYVDIGLEGPENNPKGVGAAITIHYGDQQQTAQMNPYRGYMSSSESKLHFGLGAEAVISKIEITWPDQKTSSYNNVAANKSITLKYSDAQGTYQKTSTKPLFRQVNQSETIVHEENEFDDYKNEILLPHKMSTLGPVVTVADVNRDGNDDFYLGGSSGKSGALYLGSANGQFTKTLQKNFLIDKNFEDGDAVFFDADGDRDLDLYVTSGGNEHAPGSSMYQDRLYINNSGHYTKKPLPSLVESSSAVAAHDYNNDGQIDLFVGGRQVPGKYGYTPKSYWLKNSNGNFSIDKEMEIGMITDAAFADIEGDGTTELVTCGEWTGIDIWSFQDEKWNNNSAGANLDKTDGWWNKMEISDINGDGKLDILAGNLGLNIKFKASEDQPFKLYVDDFDKNGSNDVYLGYYATDGKCYPVRGRQCSSQQMPFVKEKFESYNDFGLATIDDVLNDKLGENSVKEQVYTFHSTYFENDGQGKFKAINLGNTAQKSPIHGFAILDINKDGKKDFFAAGNYYNREVETTRSDAGTGYTAIQKEDSTFEYVPVSDSGIFSYKDVRAVHEMKMGNQTVVAVFNNNDAAEFYRLN